MPQPIVSFLRPQMRSRIIFPSGRHSRTIITITSLLTSLRGVLASQSILPCIVHPFIQVWILLFPNLKVMSNMSSILHPMQILPSFGCVMRGYVP